MSEQTTAQILRYHAGRGTDPTSAELHQAADELDTLTLNLANAEQECKDLKAKLVDTEISRDANANLLEAERRKRIQVEADAAVMREVITHFADRWVKGEINEDDDVVALLRLADDSTGVGQRLLDELATLRANQKQAYQLGLRFALDRLQDKKFFRTEPTSNPFFDVVAAQWAITAELKRTA